jgi:membrane-bound metal-dependent hydrolase YbcI (DUF457 family)
MWILPIVCMALGAAADADLLYASIHRTMTHSVTAAALVVIVAAAVTGWVTGKVEWRIALACGAAYGSHLLLDWLGEDPNPPAGIQLLWPFSDRWFIAPWTIFLRTERDTILSARSIGTNLKAIGLEVLILGPIVAVVGWWRSRTSG